MRLYDSLLFQFNFHTSHSAFHDLDAVKQIALKDSFAEFFKSLNSQE